jgi:methionyl-tRNA formyltransferase
MKIAFFGTPRFSCFVLDALDAAGYTPALIVTTPDRPAGRGLSLSQSPVKQWAIAHNIAVAQPPSLKTMNDELSTITNSEWDLFIIAGYGKILPKEIVDLPKYGSLNVHPSLLPRFRGPSPIESQILQDEKEVGVSILVMDEQMDHGPILAQARITPEEWPLRTRELEDMLWTEGGDLLVESIPAYVDGTLKPEPQDHSLATTTSFMKKEDGELDLSADGYQNYLKFCAYDEWPGTFFFVDGKRYKIKEAILENGLFEPRRVIPEGKKEQEWGGS